MTIKTHGYRITRDRQVYVFTAPAWRGRPPAERHQIWLGTITKVASGWKHDMASDIYATAEAAADGLIRICCR